MTGKRARGRQRLKMLEWIMKMLDFKGKSNLRRLQEIGEDGGKPHHQNPSIAFDTMTPKEEIEYLKTFT